jgi:hypothetical protein
MKRENSRSPKPLALRSGDVAVALALALNPGQPYAGLAHALGISLGESHNAVGRLIAARLVSQDSRAVSGSRLAEFLKSGVPYACPAELGAETRGVPTAYGAPPLALDPSGSGVPVWPSALGAARGPAVIPLYPGAPALLVTNHALYELLTLVDAVRIGRARDRERAAGELRHRLLTQPVA